MSIRNAITSAFNTAAVSIKEQQSFLARVPRKEIREVLYNVLANQQTAHVHVLPSGKMVIVYVYLYELHSFKSAKLVRLLGRLEDAGFAVKGTSDWTLDRPNRDFTYSKTVGNTGIEVHVSAYVRADSKSCRIEVVDVKEAVVKTEVKRIVCA